MDPNFTAASQSKGSYRHILLCFGALALAVVLHNSYLPYAEDDAYIHMRVARNLLQHGMPYFNPGEPVMASTAPLWIAVTAPFALFGPSQPLGVALFNSLVLTAAACVWSALFVRLFQRASAKWRIAAFLTAWATMLPSSLSLMESPLALLFAGLAFTKRSFTRHSWPLWGALACFVRPECVVFLLAAAIKARLDGRRIGKTEAAYFLVGSVPFVAAQLYFFGTIYPHTAVAKSIVYQITWTDFVRLLTFAAYGQRIAQGALPVVVLLVCIAVCYHISTSAKLPQKREVPAWSYVVLAGAVILLVYAVRRVTMFPWYAPLAFVPLHLGALGIMSATLRIHRVLGSLCLLPLAAVCVSTIGGLTRPGMYPYFESGARARALRTLGEQLERDHNGARIVAPEIGALGFAFNGTIIDSAGLVSPAALSHHPLKVPEQRSAGFIGAVPASFAAAVNPDLLVGLSIFFEDFSRSEFARQYEKSALPPVLPVDQKHLNHNRVFGSGELLVFTRKSPQSTHRP